LESNQKSREGGEKRRKEESDACFDSLVLPKLASTSQPPPTRSEALKTSQRGIETYLVTTPDQRSTGNVEESHSLGNLLPFRELGGLDVSLDLHVLLRGSHVLSESHDIDVVGSEI